MTTPISVIILTFNEESNLPGALASVKGWAKEVFVVDSHSTDRTVDIALQRAAEGVHVVQHRFEDYSKQWNWALARLPITGDWVLKLDADEQVTEAFRREVTALLQHAPGDLDGIYFRRQIVFMGRALRWGGMLENYDLRLWRNGRAAFEDRAVNEHALVQGRTAKLRSCVNHRTSKGLADWLDKHNRYSSLEARCLATGNVTGGVAPRLFGKPDQRRMWLRRLYLRMPARSLLYFLYRYLGRLGFLDGIAGFRYCFLHASFLYWIGLKHQEFLASGAPPEVVWPARGEIHRQVACSPLQRRVEEDDRTTAAAPELVKT